VADGEVLGRMGDLSKSIPIAGAIVFEIVLSDVEMRNQYEEVVRMCERVVEVRCDVRDEELYWAWVNMTEFNRTS